MREQQVQQMTAQIIGEVGNLFDLLGHHDRLHHQMADHLAVVRISKSALVSQLVNLAEIVQNGAGCKRSMSMPRNARPLCGRV